MESKERNNVNSNHFSNSKQKLHVCEICSKRFSGVAYLKLHYLVHKGQEPHICEICSKRFLMLCNLKAHRLIHTGEKPHICEVCNKGFTQLSALKTHSLIHTKHNKKRLQKFRLNSHQSVNTNDVQTSEKGNESESVDLKELTSPRTEEIAHIYEMYKMKFLFERSEKCDLDAKPKLNVCEICDKRFAHSSYLKLHYRTHTGEKPHICEVCNKEFSFSCNLMRHYFVMHKGTFFSEKKSSKLLVQNRKSSHIIHTKENLHSIDAYKRRFSMLCNSLGQDKIHKKEVSNIPGISSKEISHRNVLRSNQITLTKKKHVCEVCKKHFPNRSCLKLHNVIHTGGKPNICELCDKGFSIRCNLLNHHLIGKNKNQYSQNSQEVILLKNK